MWGSTGGLRASGWDRTPAPEKGFVLILLSLWATNRKHPSTSNPPSIQIFPGQYLKLACTLYSTRHSWLPANQVQREVKTSIWKPNVMFVIHSSTCSYPFLPIACLLYISLVPFMSTDCGFLKRKAMLQNDPLLLSWSLDSWKQRTLLSWENEAQTLRFLLFSKSQVEKQVA